MGDTTAAPETLDTATESVKGRAFLEARRLTRARNGQYLPIEPTDSAELKRHKIKQRMKKRHQLNECDYLKAATRAINTSDMADVVLQLVGDAKGGEDVDPKNVNAAREWLGKYLLGGGKQSLDLILHPEVIQGKR